MQSHVPREIAQTGRSQGGLTGAWYVEFRGVGRLSRGIHAPGCGPHLDRGYDDHDDGVCPVSRPTETDLVYENNCSGICSSLELENHPEYQIGANMEQQHQELASRLSSAGRVCFPGSAEFDKANLRFTDYERPVGSRNSVIVRSTSFELTRNCQKITSHRRTVLWSFPAARQTLQKPSSMQPKTRFLWRREPATTALHQRCVTFKMAC